MPALLACRNQEIIKQVLFFKSLICVNWLHSDREGIQEVMNPNLTPRLSGPEAVLLHCSKDARVRRASWTIKFYKCLLRAFMYIALDQAVGLQDD